MKRRRIVLFIVGIAVLSVHGATLGADRTDELDSERFDLLKHAVVFSDVDPVEESSDQYEFGDLLAIGDTNWDGNPDLVMCDGLRLQILLGNGMGGFIEGGWQYIEAVPYEDGQEIPQYRVGSLKQPYPMDERDGVSFVLGGTVLFPRAAMGDLDQDGDLDLVIAAVAFRSSILVGGDDTRVPKLYFYRGTQGDGFRRVMEWELDQIPANLWIDDLTGDGWQDIIACTWDHDREEATVWVLEQQAEGYSDERVLGVHEMFPSHRTDLDGDGYSDFLSWSRDGEIRVLQGTEAGTFNELPLASLERTIRSVEISDLTGDSTPEVVVLSDDEVIVFGLEELTLSLLTATPLDVDPMDLYLGRFDADAHTDALVQDRQGYRPLALLSGDGKGGFLPPSSELILPENYDLHVADLTGDGRDDLVDDFGRPISVYINGPTEQGISAMPFNGSRMLCAGDLNEDGAPDLLVGSPDGVDVFWNDGQGGMVLTTWAGLGLEPIVAEIGEEAVYILDLQQANGATVVVLMSIGFDGTALGRWSVRAEALPVLALGDFDADGLEDVAIPARSELLIHWGGSTELLVMGSPGGELSQLAGGDFDGDGIEELVAVSMSDTADLVTLPFVDRRPRIECELANLDVLPLSMIVADVDGDSVDDPLLVAARLAVETEVDASGKESQRLYASGAAIISYVSTQGLIAQEIEGFPESDTPWPFAGLGAEDMNADGIVDIVLTTVSSGELLILNGTGNGQFSLSTASQLSLASIQLVDLDGNGRAEIVGSTAGFAPMAAILWNGGAR